MIICLCVDEHGVIGTGWLANTAIKIPKEVCEFFALGPFASESTGDR